MNDYTELRKLAEAATRGEWHLSDDANSHVFDGRIYAISPNTFEETTIAFSDGADAEFIIAARPDVILNLLDEIDRLRSAREEE